jgi:hypothetical protein
MLGWLTYSVYNIFIKKKSIFKNIIIAMIAAYILALVKVYILAAYLPFLMLYVVFYKLKTIKKMFFKIILFSGLMVAMGASLFLLADSIQNFLGSLALNKITESVKTTQERFEGIAGLAESSFSLGVEFDGTPGSLIKIAPAAITATLFRPFLWESKKLSTLLSSIESLAFMLFTLYVLIKAGVIHFIKNIFTDPMIMYCFWYALLFAIFIGTTTLNFGTLVRYKIPCIPFYLIALMLILAKSKNKNSGNPVTETTA